MTNIPCSTLLHGVWWMRPWGKPWRQNSFLAPPRPLTVRSYLWHWQIFAGLMELNWVCACGLTLFLRPAPLNMSWRMASCLMGSRAWTFGLKSFSFYKIELDYALNFGGSLHIFHQMLEKIHMRTGLSNGITWLANLQLFWIAIDHWRFAVVIKLQVRSWMVGLCDCGSCGSCTFRSQI